MSVMKILEFNWHGWSCALIYNSFMIQLCMRRRSAIRLQARQSALSPLFSGDTRRHGTVQFFTHARRLTWTVHAKHECSRAWNGRWLHGGFCYNTIVPVFSAVWACGTIEGSARTWRGVRQSRQHRYGAYEFETSRRSNVGLYSHCHRWRRNDYWGTKASKLRRCRFKLASTCWESYQGTWPRAASDWTFVDETTSAVRVLAATSGIWTIGEDGTYFMP